MTPISNEPAERISEEAQSYANKYWKDQPSNAIAYNGYVAGATAYAHYKKRFEQAKKALEEVKPWIENDMDDDRWNVRERAGELVDMIENLLASWKEEGKEGGV